MEEYSKEEKDYLLKLARRTIEYFLDSKEKLKISDREVPFDKLKQKRAAFVTLTQDNGLRGCIGSLEPEIPLYEEIVDKAFSAAFRDPRFLPIGKEELIKTKISISVLTIPRPLSFQNHHDLLDKLIPGKDGVVLKKGNYSATYLPKVWGELPEKEQFLSSLCHKAGLSLDSWKQNDIEVFTYQTIDFSEF